MCAPPGRAPSGDPSRREWIPADEAKRKGMRAKRFREPAQRDGLAEQAVEPVDCETFRFDRARGKSVEPKASR